MEQVIKYQGQSSTVEDHTRDCLSQGVRTDVRGDQVVVPVEPELRTIVYASRYPVYDLIIMYSIIWTEPRSYIHENRGHIVVAGSGHLATYILSG